MGRPRRRGEALTRSDAHTNSARRASTKSIETAPARNRGCAIRRERKSRLVASPSTRVSASARRHSREGGAARRPASDEFGEQRVIMRRDDASLAHAGLDSEVGPEIGPEIGVGGPAQSLDAARRRKEALLRALGVEAALDGVAHGGNVAAPQFLQRIAAREAELPPPLGPPRSAFPSPGARPGCGCSFRERRSARRAPRRTRRCRAAIAHAARERDGGGRHRAARGGAEAGGGRFLDDLLEAALDRAIAFVEMRRLPGRRSRKPEPRRGGRESPGVRDRPCCRRSRARRGRRSRLRRASSAAGSSTRRIPIPPPPAAAFTSKG